MAKAFLQLVSDHIFEHYEDKVEKLCIVLPNKRAALFLKQHLARSFGKTIWLPAIISAEELIAELSGLRIPEETDLVCHLYESYKTCYGGEAEPFDAFVKWGQLILQDFNEIDRYLADPEQLYENLRDIKVIENWSLGEEHLSEYQTSYLKFMNSLGAIYRHFTAFLLRNNLAYQGLAYREAVGKCAGSDFADRYHKILFCGFNALNAAEIRIISHYHTQKKAELLWDADGYYLDNPEQEAGHFLRANLRLFPQKKVSFTGNNFLDEKEIRVVAVPKQIGQAQVVKQELQRLIGQGVALDKVAVVLANEKLLWPVLQQLPAAVQSVNITMEYPLKYTSTYTFIDLLVQMQAGFARQQRQHKTLYHKDLVALLRQPILKTFARVKAPGLKLSTLINDLTARNLSFITQQNLASLLAGHEEAFLKILQPVANARQLCDTITGVLETAIQYYAAERKNNQRQLELEYLHILLRNFNRLNDIILKYPQFGDLQAFRQLFTQVVGTSTAPFVGEPLSGLQIMGVLETRTLDFEHVIMVNVNEGVLPSGKSVNSFIPNDLKRAFGLPLYTEKDAIYAYHFYRLLQKASDVTLIYDSETDTFGKGERSRFVTQLQLEMKKYNPSVRISESVASYSGFPALSPNAIRFDKSAGNLAAIAQKAGSAEKFGALSPSGLATFKDCSLKFYFRYGVHLKETAEVEESAEANTFGSILHLSLETLYRQFSGKIIGAGDLRIKLGSVDSTVNECFVTIFGNQPAGKSILQQEVIKVYVKKLLNNDIRFVETLRLEGGHLTLLALEQEYSASLEMADGNTVYVKGKIDRIDRYKGQTRVIDYKSSVKDTDKFMFAGFEPLFHDKNYDKQLQLLLYAWLLHRNGLCEPSQLKPCIIPFRVFSEEPRFVLGDDKKPFVFTKTFFDDFEQELKRFISGIFDRQLPFSQTEDRKVCEYCAYNVICNFQP